MAAFDESELERLTGLQIGGSARLGFAGEPVCRRVPRPCSVLWSKIRNMVGAFLSEHVRSFFGGAVAGECCVARYPGGRARRFRPLLVMLAARALSTRRVLRGAYEGDLNKSRGASCWIALAEGWRAAARVGGGFVNLAVAIAAAGVLGRTVR